MSNTKIQISGMKCDHCVKHVTKALEELDGISNVQVDLKSGTATFEKSDAVDLEKITQAILKAGYQVK